MKASPGYPIPHKSLAVGWGLGEAWQNCIKQEQTSHTFLSVSYVKASEEAEPVYMERRQCIFHMQGFFFQDSGDPMHYHHLVFLVEVSVPHMPLLIYFPHSWYHTPCRWAFHWFQVYGTGGKQGTLCSKRLKAYGAVCDLIVKEWELQDARKQLITHVLGRFEPDTVGDVDGDAMCLDVKLQTAVGPSLLSH